MHTLGSLPHVSPPVTWSTHPPDDGTDVGDGGNVTALGLGSGTKMAVTLENHDTAGKRREKRRRRKKRRRRRMRMRRN